MSSFPSITTDTIARWWNQTPDHRTVGSKGRIDAAIWSGSAREIWTDADAEMNLFAMPLNEYACVPFVDGKALSHTHWRRGQFQTMVAGVSPRAVLSTPWRMLHVYISQTLVCDVSEELGLGRRVELIDQAGATDIDLVRVMSSMEAELTRGSKPSRMLIDSYGVELAALLLRRWSNVSESPRRSATTTSRPVRDWRLRRATEYMEARLAEDVSLDEVAAVVELSPSHLAALFRVSVGEPPHRWLMRRRIERACHLLVDPRRSVTEVAMACGFASSQHLATVFRKKLGVRPSDYRRERIG